MGERERVSGSVSSSGGRYVAWFFPFITETQILLPIGISFFTFQAMSYVIDVYQGEEAQRNPLNLGLYISFFPQLIAGPIVRYKTIAEEIRNRRTSWNDASEGIVIFLNGLIKKILFANNMAIIADRAFSGEAAQHGVLFLWLGALAYAFQIYFDFSGYSDMAIGLGRVFGFHFSENFRYPYAASSVTDFWKRWHISLSSWFRDYVYIPLGGSRKGNLLQVRNLFIVWLLTGIWHGANWTFVAWGLAYFILLVVEKYVIRPERFKSRVTRGVYRIFVLAAVYFCWILFRAANLHEAFHYLKAMLGLYGNPLVDDDWLFYAREYIVLFALAAAASVPLLRAGLRRVRSWLRPGLFETLRAVAYALFFLICVSYLVMGSHNPFIYFNF